MLKKMLTVLLAACLLLTACSQEGSPQSESPSSGVSDANEMEDIEEDLGEEEEVYPDPMNIGVTFDDVVRLIDSRLYWNEGPIQQTEQYQSISQFVDGVGPVEFRRYTLYPGLVFDYLINEEDGSLRQFNYSFDTALLDEETSGRYQSTLAYTLPNIFQPSTLLSEDKPDEELDLDAEAQAYQLSYENDYRGIHYQKEADGGLLQIVPLGAQVISLDEIDFTSAATKAFQREYREPDPNWDEERIDLEWGINALDVYLSQIFDCPKLSDNISSPYLYEGFKELNKYGEQYHLGRNFTVTLSQSLETGWLSEIKISAISIPSYSDEELEWLESYMIALILLFDEENMDQIVYQLGLDDYMKHAENKEHVNESVRGKYARYSYLSNSGIIFNFTVTLP